MIALVSFRHNLGFAIYRPNSEKSDTEINQLMTCMVGVTILSARLFLVHVGGWIYIFSLLLSMNTALAVSVLAVQPSSRTQN